MTGESLSASARRHALSERVTVGATQATECLSVAAYIAKLRIPSPTSHHPRRILPRLQAPDRGKLVSVMKRAAPSSKCPKRSAMAYGAM